MAKRRFAFNPVGMDAFDPKPWHPKPGDHVVFSNQGGGVTGHRGRGGLRDFRYIEHAETGEFHGMALKSSLVPVTKKNPGKPDPVEAARVAGVFNDRRGSRSGYQMPTPVTLGLRDLEGEMTTKNPGKPGS